MGDSGGRRRRRGRGKPRGPDERPAVLRAGILLVDKPSGPSTFDLIRDLRRRFRTKRVGHTGTLDPLATGLVVLCLNEATKLARYLGEGEKAYTCTLRLGEARDSLDAQGQVVGTAPVPRLDPKQVQAALDGLVGPRLQRPPAFSAVKKDGQPLYRYARAGQEVEVEPRPITVYEARLLDGAGADWRFHLRVSAGTYVRVLAAELGQALGTLAHVTALRRTANAGWSVDQAVDLATLTDARSLEARLIQPAEALAHLPSLRPEAPALARFRNGGFLEPPPGLGPSAVVAVLDADGRLAGVGRVLPDPSQETQAGAPLVLKPERLLLPDDEPPPAPDDGDSA